MKGTINIVILVLVFCQPIYGIDVEFNISTAQTPIILNSDKSFNFEVKLKSSSFTPHGKLEIFLRNPDGTSERVYYCGGDLCIRSELWVWADNLNSYIYLIENKSFTISSNLHQQGYGEFFARFTASSGQVYNSTSYTTLKDTVNPTVVTNLRGENVTDQSFVLRWTHGQDNVGVKGYDIFQGGTKIGSTTQNFFNFSGLTNCTSYNLSVVTLDDIGNTSPNVSVTVTTNSGIASTVTLNTDKSGDIQLTLEATGQINLQDGFKFKASSSSHSFVARIVDDTCLPSIGRISSFDQGTLIYTEDKSFSYAESHSQIPDIIKSRFDIYPNPSKYFFTIKTEDDKYLRITMYSMMGVIVKDISSFGSSVTLDISSLNNGIYWLKIYEPNNSQVSVHRLVIEH